MMTTKSMAASVCPNHPSASGTQHTLGNACIPSASTPTVSWKTLNFAVKSPSGMPSRSPTA